MKVNVEKTIVKAVRLHESLLQRAEKAKEKYEVPISLNRFIVHSIEKEVERKEENSHETLSESE